MATTQKKPTTTHPKKEVEVKTIKSEEEVVITPSVTNTKTDSVEGDYNDKVKRDPTIFQVLEYKPSGKPINEDIKDALSIYKKQTKVPSIIGTAVTLSSVGLILASLITLFVKVESNNPVKIILFSLTGAMLVAAFILSRIVSKKRTAATTSYLDKYETIVNGETFNRLGVKQGQLSVAGKIDDQDVIQTHYFATINDIHSRGISEGKRNNKGLRCGELAILIPPVSFSEANKLPTKYFDLEGKEVEVKNPEVEVVPSTPSISLFKKQQEPTETYFGIYGKLFSYDLKVESNESIIIAFRGGVKNTFLPNYLTGFEAIKVEGLNDNVVVYAIDINKSKKFFDKKGIDLLNSLKTDEDFLSGFISVNSYGVRVGLNLSERLMQLPLDNKNISQEAYDSFFIATKKMFEFVDHIEKK